MSNLKDDTLHRPPTSRYRLYFAFRGDWQELEEYHEDIKKWGYELIRGARFRRGERSSFFLLTLEITGGDPNFYVAALKREMALWGSIQLRSVREGQRWYRQP